MRRLMHTAIGLPSSACRSSKWFTSLQLSLMVVSLGLIYFGETYGRWRRKAVSACRRVENRIDRCRLLDRGARPCCRDYSLGFPSDLDELMVFAFRLRLLKWPFGGSQARDSCAGYLRNTAGRSSSFTQTIGGNCGAVDTAVACQARQPAGAPAGAIRLHVGVKPAGGRFVTSGEGLKGLVWR